MKKKKSFWIVVALLLFVMAAAVVVSSFGTEVREAEFVTLVKPVGNLSECKLPTGAVLSELTLNSSTPSKGMEREIYSVPFGAPDHTRGGCQAGDRILNRTIGNGR